MEGWTDAVVLAGDEKVFRLLAGRPMVDYVVAALRDVPEVARIAVVGDPARLAALYGGTAVVCVAPGETPLANFAAGLDALPGGCPWVLACAGDIPFLTPAAVQDFLRRCRAREADLYYPIVRRADAEARFPGVRRTYARLREGWFTGGNMFLVRKEVVPKILGVAADFVAQRKNPLGLARLVGARILWKYLWGRLTVADVERRVLNCYGVTGAGIITPFPEIGVDVDKPEDFDLARRLLEQESPM